MSIWFVQTSIKTSKQLKNIFLDFSVFLLTFVRVSFHFCSTYHTKVFTFASASRFDSKLRKHLPARWLNPTSWLSANLGAKVPGEQVYVSETKLTYALSPQCFHSLSRWASMLLYNICINFFHSCNFRCYKYRLSNLHIHHRLCRKSPGSIRRGILRIPQPINHPIAIICTLCTIPEPI